MANGKDDIRVALGWPRHFKRRALQNELGTAGPLALIDLWCFAGEHRPDGVFKSPDEVEVAVDWPRRLRGRLVAALIATGWLEADGVTLHDWQDEQPWIANRPARVAAARANGSAGGRAKAAKSQQSGAESATNPPSGMGGGSVADGYRNASEVLPPSPSPTPTPTPTPTPQPQRAMDPAAAAAGATPPGTTPDPLAADLATRLAWASVATVAGMLTELRGEGFTDADLRTRIEATTPGRCPPWDWAKATRKARGPRSEPTTDRDRAALRRSAERFAGYARDAERIGNAKAASEAWNAVRLRAGDLGVDPAEFGAPPLTSRSLPAKTGAPADGGAA